MSLIYNIVGVYRARRTEQCCIVSFISCIHWHRSISSLGRLK